MYVIINHYLYIFSIKRLTLAFWPLLSTTYLDVLVLLEDGLKSLESKLAQLDQGIERLQQEKMRPKMDLKEAAAPAFHARLCCRTDL